MSTVTRRTFLSTPGRDALVEAVDARRNPLG